MKGRPGRVSLDLHSSARRSIIAALVFVALFLGGYQLRIMSDSETCFYDRRSSLDDDLGSCDCELGPRGQWLYGVCEDVPATHASATGIVWARFLAVRSQANADGTTGSMLEFEVLRALRGRYPRDRLVLRYPEGFNPSGLLDPPVVPPVSPADEFVLILGTDEVEHGDYVRYYGAYPILRHPETGAGIVTPNPGKEIQMFHAADDVAYREPPATMPLEDFLFSLEKLR
jgi:hypothetical protein